FTLIEFIAELLLRARPKLLDFQHSNFVGAGLSGIHDVTLDLRFHFLFAHAGFLMHVGDRLFTRPMFGVNPGINDQTHSAEKFVTQTAEITERIFVVPTGLFREPFGVERPAFGISSKWNDFAKLRKPCELLRD